MHWCANFYILNGPSNMLAPFVIEHALYVMNHALRLFFKYRGSYMKETCITCTNMLILTYSMNLALR